MSGYLKFEPHPWSTPLLRASLGAHVVLPLAAGYLAAPVFATGECGDLDGVETDLRGTQPAQAVRERESPLERAGGASRMNGGRFAS